MPTISYLGENTVRKQKEEKKPNLHVPTAASFIKDLVVASYIKVACIYMQNLFGLDIQQLLNSQRISRQ